jgi:cysteine desulfurase/selenocysteine lyase
VVLQALQDYYASSNANVHRGVHHLSGKATDLFEGARARIAKFIGTSDPKEVIFTRNATEGINLVAQTLGRANVTASDEIVISAMEHHSNIVPWQMLCEEKGARLRVIPMFDSGELDIEALGAPLGADADRSDLGVVNALGGRLSSRSAHGAQGARGAGGRRAAVPHARERPRHRLRLLRAHRAQGVRADGHRVLYGKAALLDAMPPGRAAERSARTSSDPPGTCCPQVRGGRRIAGAVGLGAAVDYIGAIGMDRIQAYERELLAYGTEALRQVPGLTLVGTAPQKASILSFVMDGIHPHDLGTIVDREGVAIRTGHHCAQPVMDRLGIPATARASLAMYNTREEIDALVAALGKARQVFG